MRKTMQILFAVLLCPLLAAQQTVDVTIARETKIPFVLLESVSSATAKKGQIVHLALAKDIAIGGVTIPKGTPAEGKVASARKARPGKYDGYIDVKATSILLSNGQRLPLRRYPPGEDDCGGMGPCIALAIAVLPVAIVAFTAVAISSPVLLIKRAHDGKPSPNARITGTEMTLKQCDSIEAYPPWRITIRPSTLVPLTASSAAEPITCEATN